MLQHLSFDEFKTMMSDMYLTSRFVCRLRFLWLIPRAFLAVAVFRLSWVRARSSVRSPRFVSAANTASWS